MARISREKYNVPLNAVAHRTYSAMFSYIRRPTLKKPLAKLDAEPYFSDLHPKDEQLERLLEASARSDAIRTCKKDLSKKRGRAPDLYNLVHEKRFRTALDLQAHAAKNGLQVKAQQYLAQRNGFRVQIPSFEPVTTQPSLS